ncbi:MAG TPA: cyclic nucleotide-binding domain-containing protein [Blastocatellia bacterium]|jgi:Fe-S-cluster-containing dehydrogenase component/CRP-like cAMP-binding protein
MPQEITKHSEVLSAIESIGAIADLTAQHDGHYDYELDLEVIVYGRNYNGKRVGPYVKLLTYAPGEEIVREGDWGGNSFFIVVDGKADVLFDEGRTKVAEIPAGVQFGEMSVLAGMPRTATIRAPQDQPVQIMEVLRPALRLLRKLPKFGEVLDSTYRRNGRATTIQDIGASTQLSKEAISQLEAISQFKVFGKNHVLFRAGDVVKSLYVLKSGWARLTPMKVTRQLTPLENVADNWNAKAPEAYYGPSHCFGVEAITRDGNWEQTCTLMGRTEVLEISLSQLRKHPELREILLLAFTGMAAPDNPNEGRQPLPIARAQEALIETGLVDGTNLLVMDMDMCVRCGNCSMACHQMHGRSRLLRRGVHVTRPVSMEPKSSFQSLLSPSVCMHCQDPECLTGCPTGAIGRFPGGQVDIDPKTCIGCGDCATQCPYNAISMVPRKSAKVEVGVQGWKGWFELKPDPLPPSVETTEDLLAVKCNLCQGTTLNPPGAKRKAYSCEENCPTGALLRVDPHTYFAEIKNVEGTIFRDSTHVVARHTSHKDFGKRLIHALGLGATLVLTLVTILGMFRYGLEQPLIGTWLDIRWLTGIVGLIGIAGVMAYPIRRQRYKKRSGPLRYWMLAHSYLGVIAGILILLHGGTESGGALTTALMVSFDLVILTGLFGILIYYFAPRVLTKIEGQPLLHEDLVQRREELSEDLGATMAAAAPPVRTAIQQQVIPRILSFSFLTRQYLKRESLDEMLESVTSDFKQSMLGLNEAEKGKFVKAVETAATMRRVDALIYLHQLLKLWLAPHVLVTSLMLALLLAHIIQVIYFLAR